MNVELMILDEKGAERRAVAANEPCFVPDETTGGMKRVDTPILECFNDEKWFLIVHPSESKSKRMIRATHFREIDSAQK